MQRVIKYRALNSKNEFVFGMPTYDFLYIFNGDQFKSIDEYFINPETIGQFTGLEDKNGIEIYEGDILKMPYLNKLKEVRYSEFNNCGCCGEVAGIGFNFEELEYGNIEVIGNIHQNPELLNGSD